jgi:hypothetical protein
MQKVIGLIARRLIVQIYPTQLNPMQAKPPFWGFFVVAFCGMIIQRPLSSAASFIIDGP